MLNHELLCVKLFDESELHRIFIAEVLFAIMKI